MSDKDNTRSLERRTVVKSVAGLGAAGLATQTAAAASGDREDYKLGPLADVAPSEKLTYEEYRRLLQTDDNGSVELVRGDVVSQETYVGDQPDVSVSETKRRFEGGLTADETFTRCLDTPWYAPQVCADLTVNVTDAGIEVTLVVAGFPIVDTTLPKGASATYDFDVPGLPVTGTLTVAGELTGFCSAEVSASLGVEGFGQQLGPVELNESFTYC